MKKILIVSFYELKEYLLSISDIFIDTYKWDVCYYPLFMYYKDEHNKIDNYKEHFSEFISENKPDIILWWYYGVPIDIIHYIKLKHPEIFYIIYEYSKDTDDKLLLFDYILTENHLNLPNKQIDYFQFGYDKMLYRKYNENELASIDKKYICDVSLYSNDIVNNITNKNRVLEIEKYCITNDLKFNQYGSEKLCSSHIHNYNYYNLPQMLNSSKINIVSSNIIFGSISCGTDTLLFDENIIDNLENNNYIEHPKNNYSWNKFCELIFIAYNKKIFDYDFYVKTYKLDITDKTLIYKHWQDKLLEKNIIDIPYKISIPDNFDLESYKSLFNINYDNEYYYIQWFMCGKDKNFIKIPKKQDLILDGNKYNIQTNKMFELFYGFNMISSHTNIYDGFDIVSKITKNSPNLDINELVKMYNDINN
uniref:Uncharacterized protein n=1 Tax=viral metagenome TaxID=1070528 RepID=A0A6C0E2F8_9ZZZZ